MKNIAAMFVCGLVLVAGAVADTDSEKIETSCWGMTFGDFFGAGKPLQIYPARREGKWTGAMGSSLVPGTKSYGFNQTKFLVDMGGVVIQGDTVKGTIRMALPADPWMPSDQKPRHATIELDAKIGPPAAGKTEPSITGAYTAKLDPGINPAGLTVAGQVSGAVGQNKAKMMNSYTMGLMLETAIPGGMPTDRQRRLPINLYVMDGKPVGAECGSWMWRGPYDMQAFDPPKEIRFDLDSFETTLAFPFVTLGAERVILEVALTGGRVQHNGIGTYKMKVKYEDGRAEEKDGYWFGTATEGAKEIRVVKDDRAWWAPAAGYAPVAPGEHPRLFFRRSDLPELKRRAATPEGKIIVARLKELLGGGEAMPTSVNPDKTADRDGSETPGWKPQTGSFSISHAAGFGFLYQLTGDRKYADLARQCVELSLSGTRCFDHRYALVRPYGELRAGPSLGWHAVAYDLCYDAWDPEFREKFAKFIQDYENPPLKAGQEEGITLRRMAMAPGQGPNSNHYGSIIGGCGLAVLAIMGDPGTDKDVLALYDRSLQIGVTKLLNGGFGDGGFFSEGMGPGQIATDTGFVPYLQALRVAQGRDYINAPRPNARNLTLVRVWELIGPPAVYPHRSCMPASYGDAEFHKERDGLSRGGQFAQGFGAIPDALKPAALWTFNHAIEPDPTRRTFDTVSAFPHRPMLALINWPFGVAEQNPGELLPKSHRDRLYEYWVFRNRWQDASDTVVTCLLNSAQKIKPAGTMIWGLGERAEIPRLTGDFVVGSQTGKDRSGVIWTPRDSMAVDFSGASGAATLVVLGPFDGKVPVLAKSVKGRLEAAKLGAKTFLVFTLVEAGEHPRIDPDGAALTIGKQKVRFDGQRLALGVFTPVDL